MKALVALDADFVNRYWRGMASKNRERMQLAPAKQAAPGGGTFSDDVLEWLSEGGVEDSGRADGARLGLVSIFAIAADGGDGFAAYAVADQVIPAEVRQALDRNWVRTFSVEEIVDAGQLWMLAFTGHGDAHVYAWQGPNVGVPATDLVAAHDAANGRWVGELSTLRGATITRCYAVHLAH